MAPRNALRCPLLLLLLLRAFDAVRPVGPESPPPKAQTPPRTATKTPRLAGRTPSSSANASGTVRGAASWASDVGASPGQEQTRKSPAPPQPLCPEQAQPGHGKTLGRGIRSVGTLRAHPSSLPGIANVIHPPSAVPKVPSASLAIQASFPGSLPIPCSHMLSSTVGESA